ncbi:unnamed protein product [Amoebophrya sp. A120]|nr:unnamed protein product [Amoebophrya sp. A120]|eukprot:GSA120T00005170001.1
MASTNPASRGQQTPYGAANLGHTRTAPGFVQESVREKSVKFAVPEHEGMTKWLRQMFVKLVFYTVIGDILICAALALFYAGDGGGGPSCPQTNMMVAWLVTGVIGSIPTTMAIHTIYEFYENFRLAFVAESVATFGACIWLAAGTAYTFTIPAGDCRNILWLLMAFFSLITLVFLFFMIGAILMTTLVPALYKLTQQVSAALSGYTAVQQVEPETGNEV